MDPNPDSGTPKWVFLNKNNFQEVLGGVEATPEM
jgi:hypothetical protein